MSQKVSKTWSSHTNDVLNNILSFLKPSEGASLGVDIPARLAKDEWGMVGLATARFLTPRRHLDGFGSAPERYFKSYPYTVSEV